MTQCEAKGARMASIQQGRKRQGGIRLEPDGGARRADTSIADSRPPELCKNKSLLLQDTQLVAPCSATLRNQHVW